jgi:hypothetical protein
MAKAESTWRKLVELIFFIAVLGCIALALIEIGSNISAEMEEQYDGAPSLTLPNSSK